MMESRREFPDKGDVSPVFLFENIRVVKLKIPSA